MRHAVAQVRRVFRNRLVAFVQMAFHHQADQRTRAFDALLDDAAPDVLLLREFAFPNWRGCNPPSAPAAVFRKLISLPPRGCSPRRNSFSRGRRAARRARADCRRAHDARGAVLVDAQKTVRRAASRPSRQSPPASCRPCCFSSRRAWKARSPFRGASAIPSCARQSPPTSSGPRCIAARSGREIPSPPAGPGR
jgi:hypothetical protein